MLRYGLGIVLLLAVVAPFVWCSADSPPTVVSSCLAVESVQQTGAERCPVCGGQGSVECPVCGGWGRIGDKTCSRCNGFGSVTCSRCRGSGYIQKRQGW